MASHRKPAPGADRSLRIIIVGAGMSGILAGIQLLGRGYRNVTLLEKGPMAGGTWHHNRYPGVACDVPSHYYCYSFAPNPDWSGRYPGGDEIRRYFETCARRAGVLDRVKFGVEVARAHWDGAAWQVATSDGSALQADVLICSTGILHHPRYPTIPGIETFAGPAFHTARWNAGVDLAGKRVALIGTGSTAAQIVPAIANTVTSLLVFQRTAQWVVPVKNTRYRPWQQWALRRMPFLTRGLYRHHARFLDRNFSMFVTGERDLKPLRELALAHLGMVRDPELRHKLTPDYAPGCRRIVFSPDFYDAIQKQTVRLVTDLITRADADGLFTADGAHHGADVVIFSTGFHSDAYMRPMELVGANGRSIEEIWASKPLAYRSVSVPHMPNFFMTIGPHSPVGNLSLVNVAEHQVRYICECVDHIARTGEAISAREDAAEARVAAMRSALGSTVWSTGCHSWYLDREGYPGIYPWGLHHFISDMAAPPDLEDYDRQPRRRTATAG